jgi:glycosyltransferase involved in cell wall biosynthesis
MKKKPRILMLHRQQSAVGYYRSWVPARYLHSKGYDVSWWEDRPYTKALLKNALPPGNSPRAIHEKIQNTFVKKNVGQFDLIWVDRALDFDELGTFFSLRHLNPDSRMIVDFDDNFCEVPRWNPAHSKYNPGQNFRVVGEAHLKGSEVTTVSTDHLRTYFLGKAHHIRTCKNCIDPKDWENLPLNPDREKDPHLRVLYGGAAGHYGDMDEARLGLEVVLENPPVPFRLICFGALPAWLHEMSRKHPSRVIRLPWVPFRDYPSAVAWGGFDVALAPLQECVFNDGKSNIKALEAGIQKIPLLCSEVGPYKEIPDGCAVKISNTPVQWSEGLRNLLTDKALRERIKKRAYEWVQDSWVVDKHGSQWEDVIAEALVRPRIEGLEDTRLKDEKA